MSLGVGARSCRYKPRQSWRTATIAECAATVAGDAGRRKPALGRLARFHRRRIRNEATTLSHIHARVLTGANAVYSDKNVKQRHWSRPIGLVQASSNEDVKSPRPPDHGWEVGVPLNAPCRLYGSMSAMSPHGKITVSGVLISARNPASGTKRRDEFEFAIDVRRQQRRGLANILIGVGVHAGEPHNIALLA